MWSAPSFLARSTLSSFKSVCMTISAPDILTSCKRRSPIGPAPTMATISPVLMAALSKPLIQQATGSIKAASSNVRFSGNLWTFSLFVFTYSAKAPSTSTPTAFSPSQKKLRSDIRQKWQEPHTILGSATTWSPISKPSTWSPSSAMVPENSCPGTSGAATSHSPR